MLTVELAVILLNAVLLLLAYFWWYPRVAGADLRKVAVFDTLITLLALLIVGSRFWSTEQAFELFGFNTNWFWFTLVTYLILEMPLAIWYFRRYGPPR